MQRKLLRSPFTSAISSTVIHLEDRNLLGIRADNRRRQQTRVSNLAAMQQHLAKSQVIGSGRDKAPTTGEQGWLLSRIKEGWPFSSRLIDLRLCNPGMVRVECIETRGRHSEWLCEAVLYEAVQIHSGTISITRPRTSTDALYSHTSPGWFAKGKAGHLCGYLSQSRVAIQTLASPIRLSHRSIADWRRIY